MMIKMTWVTLQTDSETRQEILSFSLGCLLLTNAVFVATDDGTETYSHDASLEDDSTGERGPSSVRRDPQLERILTILDDAEA